MPTRRFILWEGHRWTLSRLAHAYHLAPSTLNHRLERFGETATGIQRSLCTGIIDPRVSGRHGAQRSSWGYAFHSKPLE